METEGPLQGSEEGPAMDLAQSSSVEGHETHRKVCFSFQRGYCKFGDTCKYAHVVGGDNKRRRRGDGDSYERIGGESADRYGPRRDSSGGNFTAGGFRGDKPNRNVKQRKPGT